MNAPVLGTYDPNGFYCEMTRSNANHAIRDRLGALSVDDLKQRAAQAEAELHDLGITFTVYSDKDAIDRVLPFDAIPRVISATEWRGIQGGGWHRVGGPEPFLPAIYHKQRILPDGVGAADVALGN